MIYSKSILVLTGLIASACTTSAFVTTPSVSKNTAPLYMASLDDSNPDAYKVTKTISSTRKAFLASIITASASIAGFSNGANAEESFESIAARAASMAQNAEKEEDEAKQLEAKIASDPRTAYDFSLPMSGDNIPFEQLIKQEFIETKVENQVPNADGSEGITTVMDVQKDPKVKAILVVNMKQDDPIARKNIPELISLASKYVWFVHIRFVLRKKNYFFNFKLSLFHFSLFSHLMLNT